MTKQIKPRWWEPGEVPSVEGKFIESDDTVWNLPEYSKDLKDNLKILPSHRLYGPLDIPDPPKPLPKLRRFEATYNGERVAGVWRPVRDARRQFDCLIDRLDWDFVDLKDLIDIRWLDEE